MNFNYTIPYKRGNREFIFLSNPGLYSRDRIADATKYLLSQIPLEEKLGNILDLGCGYGVIGISLQSQSEKTILVDSDLRAWEGTQANLIGNKITQAELHLKDDLDEIAPEPLDHIFFNPPVHLGSELIFQLMHQSFQYLKTGGKFWMIGKKDKGIARYKKEMEKVLGPVNTLFRKRGYHLLQGTKTLNTSYHPQDYHYEIKEGPLVFHTQAGLFSRKEIDPGSRFLLNTITEVPPGDILDLGCGYGFLGISLGANHSGKVLLTDVDKRAVKWASHNIKLGGYDHMEAQLSDGFRHIDEKRRFGLIVTNPPFHQGQEVIFPFLEEARRRLKPGGLLAMVIMRPQAYEKKIRELFSTLIPIYGTDYTVLKAIP